MQAALNKQLKADKEAERSRLERLEQERLEREESLRELSIKYRKRFANDTFFVVYRLFLVVT